LQRIEGNYSRELIMIRK